MTNEAPKDSANIEVGFGLKKTATVTFSGFKNSDNASAT